MHLQVPVGERFTVLDWIGTVVAAFSALALTVFPVAGRVFARMFEDFGSSSELPLLTRLATSAWFPIVLAVPVVVALVLGLRRNSPLSNRRAWVVTAFVLGCVSFGVCLVGAYLPLFSIAGAVRTD